MIIVTGAAGFIASALISELNKYNFNNIIAVDLFDSDLKNQNIEGKKITQKVNRHELHDWIQLNHEEIEHAMSDGIKFIENVSPEEIDIDQYGNPWVIDVFG